MRKMSIENHATELAHTQSGNGLSFSILKKLLWKH